MAVVDLSDFKEFPATDLLGFGLDFTTLTPMDIQSVIRAKKDARRIIRYYPDEDTRKHKVGDIEYDVPRIIGVIPFTISDGTYVTYATGSEASSALMTSTSLSMRYLAVSTSASVGYSIDKNYRREDQWAMYSLNADTYLASLRDYADLLAHDSLLQWLEDLADINDGSNAAVVKAWRDFFSAWGSHVIIKAAYGARFQLNVWASNSAEEVNERFSASVGFAFNGIFAGGSFDAEVGKEEQYKKFENFMQKQVSVVGGNQRLNTTLAADPTVYETYMEWAGSIAEDSSATSLEVQPLWELMRLVYKTKDAADKVEAAYNYIITHTQTYKTLVILDIQSDWAEFNLLAPHAVIIPDTANPFPDKTVASNTRVQWGREHSHDYKRMTLRFYVVNDGSPIDFSISRGSNSAKPGEGLATAKIETIDYENDKVTDDVWNTKWFYHAPVSNTPATTRNSDLARKVHTWGEILKAYLEEIGAIDWL